MTNYVWDSFVFGWRGSNLSARRHPLKVHLGTVHKASLWVLPAGIHLKTAEHNFGIKVELDLKQSKENGQSQ